MNKHTPTPPGQAGMHTSESICPHRQAHKHTHAHMLLHQALLLRHQLVAQAHTWTLPVNPDLQTPGTCPTRPSVPNALLRKLLSQRACNAWTALPCTPP